MENGDFESKCFNGLPKPVVIRRKKKKGEAGSYEKRDG